MLYGYEFAPLVQQLARLVTNGNTVFTTNRRAQASRLVALRLLSSPAQWARMLETEDEYEDTPIDIMIILICRETRNSRDYENAECMQVLA